VQRERRKKKSDAKSAREKKKLNKDFANEKEKKTTPPVAFSMASTRARKIKWGSGTGTLHTAPVVRPGKTSRGRGGSDEGRPMKGDPEARDFDNDRPQPKKKKGGREGVLFPRGGRMRKGTVTRDNGKRHTIQRVTASDEAISSPTKEGGERPLEDAEGGSGKKSSSGVSALFGFESQAQRTLKPTDPGGSRRSRRRKTAWIARALREGRTQVPTFLPERGKDYAGVLAVP